MTLHIAVFTHVGLGSLARLTLPLHQRRVACVSYPSLRDLQFLYGELCLHFLPRSEEEKPPSTSTDITLTFWHSLIKWEVFPFSSFLFLYFFTHSLISLSHSLSLSFLPQASHIWPYRFFFSSLVSGVSAFSEERLPDWWWMKSCTPMVPELVLSS